MKLLWKYLSKYKRLLAGALGLATINQVFSMLDPQIFRIIIDNYATKAFELTRQEFLTGVLWLLAAYVGVALVSRIAKNLQDYNVNVITQRVGTNLYANSVNHSFSLPYASFEDQRSGELLRKMEKAKTDSQALIGSLVNVVFLSLVGIIFVIIYASYVHWSIGLAYASLIPILSFITFALSKKIRSAQEKIVKQMADLSGSTTETLRNVELVKSLGLEDQEINRLNEVNDKILYLELEKVKLVRNFSFIQGTVINALRSALMFLLLWLIFQQLVTVGEFFTLFVYSFFIFSPLSELGNMAAQYQEAKASMGILENILNTPPEAKPASPKVIKEIKEISFNSTGFFYPSSKDLAVEDINLKIKAGDTVAFVGPSGSGKTTLVKLLVGLYKSTSGDLFFNNTNSKEIDYEALRHRIGLVAQETQLFSGTVRENLLFVSPDATDDQCLEAMKLAAASSIISQNGNGLDTRIGEGGLKLSGGQKQRLAIARALLRQPDLIIFDEATSSLDSLTEKEVTKTIQDIEKARPGVITVMIAHRLSTIAHAKRVYVLEKGRIIETGNHDELISKGGLYAALWREQIAISD